MIVCSIWPGELIAGAVNHANSESITGAVPVSVCKPGHKDDDLRTYSSSSTAWIIASVIVM